MRGIFPHRRDALLAGPEPKKWRQRYPRNPAGTTAATAGGQLSQWPTGPGPPKRLVALLDGGSVGDFEDAMPQPIARGSTARPPD